MPEVSAGYIENTQIKEPLSPLSSENYRDFAVQRKIIKYFSEKQDTKILDQPDVEVWESERKSFNERLHVSNNDYIFTTDIDNMLKFIPGPFEGEIAQRNYFELAEKLDSEHGTQKIISSFMGVERGVVFASDIAKFLENNLSPRTADSKAKQFLDELKQVHGSAATLEAEKALKVFLDGIYGNKMKYWKNYNDLFEKENPPKLKRTIKKMKAAKVAAAGLAVYATVHGVDGVIDSASKIINSNDHVMISDTDGIRQESDLENEVEKKFNIEILDVREAFKILGKKFNVYDEEVLGRHPPTRWSEDQIKLLNDLLPELPSKFYSVLNSEVLSFALTDYGENCPCAGSFHESSSNRKSALVFLSDKSFSSENLSEARRVLFHELAHRVDIDVLERSMWPKVNKILGFNSFSEARQTYAPKVKEVRESSNELGNLAFWLNYGFMGIENKGLSEPTEFIAVLAETYADGPNEFMKFGNFLGNDKASELYNLLKNDMFDGKEYLDKSEFNKDAENSNFENDFSITDEVTLQSIEEDFNVNLIEGDDPIEWVDNSKLDNLNKVLKNIPEEFYASELDKDGNEKKLKIILGNKTELLNENKLIIDKDIKDESEMLAEIGSVLAKKSSKYNEFKEAFHNLVGDEVKVKELDLVLNKTIQNFIYSVYGKSNFFMIETSLFIDHLMINSPGQEKTDKIYELLSEKLFNGKTYVYNQDSKNNELK